MLQEIERKVKSLQKEVDDLHPILRELFTAMGEVKHVDKTHGPNEMGADFILTTTHNIFKTDKYVGIIAKNTSINQSTEDVERQIGECFDISRISARDNKTIQIGEVWVITTQNISNNAKTKFHARYAGKSVIFIDGSELSSLINQYIPHFMTGLPFKTSMYLEKTRIRNTEVDKNYSLLPSENVHYIQQDIVKIEEDFYNNRKVRRSVERINMLNEIENQKFILIEGGFGSGKSKLIRRLIDQFCDTATYREKKIIPIDITFREFFDTFESSLIQLLKSRIDFEDEIEEAKFVFMIDGLDEKNLSFEERDEVISKIKKELAENAMFRVVITSRPVLDRINYKNKLSGVSKYEVSQLSTRKVFEFIENICRSSSIHARLLKDIKRSPLMRDLPKSPIAAILLAQLIQENSRDLPSNITELYSKYFDLCIGRWDIKKNIHSSKEYEVIENVLLRIAEIMTDENRAFLTISEVKTYIEEYSSKRVLGFDNEKIFSLMKLRNDLIIVDESSEQFMFKHRSFCEYAYARKLTRSQNFTGNPEAFNVFWANIYFFAFGITKDASRQLKQLNEYVPKSDIERFFKIANMPDFALAAYATQYDDISEVVKKGAEDMAALYLDIVSRKSEMFANIPKMVLLYILQMIFRNSYSYDLFKPALESTAYSLVESSEKDVLPYELYFLNTALVDIDKKGNLDLLTKLADCQLPIDLSLALKSESDKMEVTFEGVKKNNRRIHRMLKDSKTRKMVKELYEKPILHFKRLPEKST